MKIGPHEKVHEYDGAYRCYRCDSIWGAVTGQSGVPAECKPRADHERVKLKSGGREVEAALRLGPDGLIALSLINPDGNISRVHVGTWDIATNRMKYALPEGY